MGVHIRTYENIVIGSCLEAVLYAFEKRYPIFFTEPSRPPEFSYLPEGIDFGLLDVFEWPSKSLTTLNGKNNVGVPRNILWERLIYLLSLDGNNPLSGLCHNIRYDGDRVVCSNEYSKIMEFNFMNCHYFGDPNSSGFATHLELDHNKILCYDYIAFNSGGKHEIDYLHTGDDFVSEIWFYSSNRIDGNTPIKDACAVSKLKQQQLIDFDYSETMARFKVIDEMKKIGMKGNFAYDYTTAGNPKHHSFRTTSIRREIHSQQFKSINPADGVYIKDKNWKTMLENLPSSALGYDRFLRKL